MEAIRFLVVGLALVTLLAAAAAEDTGITVVSSATSAEPIKENVIAANTVVSGTIQTTTTSAATGSAEKACMPVCDAIGTRSEGFYDSCTGQLILWWQYCQKAVVKCMAQGTRSQGWYDAVTGKRIKYGTCYDPSTAVVVVGSTDPQVAEGCICQALYAPVCGIDGATYSNSCVAKCSGVEIAYAEKCKTETECKYYEDEKGCKITKCTDGSSRIDCPGDYEPNCKRYLDEKGCVVYECTDGTRKVSCPDPDSTVTCKEYKDEKGCIITACTNGKTTSTCPIAQECKKYVDEAGCTVMECSDGRVARDCPDDTQCKVYKDEKTGCIIKECTNGDVTRDCPTLPPEEYCKYYYDEKGCRVKSCSDGSTTISCPTNVEPTGTEPAIECKKIELEDGCVKKACSNGYEAVYCPSGTGSTTEAIEEAVPQIIAVECKVYMDEAGCRVKSCADGYEHRSCPVDEGTCTVYEEETGCKTRICKDGTKVEECPAAEVIASPLKQAAQIRIKETVQTMATNQGAVDLTTSTVKANVRSGEGEELKELEISKDGQKLNVKVGNVSATTVSEVRVSENRLRVADKLVNILPDEALVNVKKVAGKMQAVEMELSGVQDKAKYLVRGVEKGNLLWVIPVEMDVSAEVDAESGAVSNVAKPWWSFLVASPAQ